MEDDWRSDLSHYFVEYENDENQSQVIIGQEKAKDEHFLASVAVPAFQEIKVELEKYGREVTVSGSALDASIKIVYQKHVEFDYSILGRTLKVYPIQTFGEYGSSFNAEGSLRQDSKDYIVRDMTKLELIQHCLKAYRDSRPTVIRPSHR